MYNLLILYLCPRDRVPFFNLVRSLLARLWKDRQRFHETPTCATVEATQSYSDIGLHFCYARARRQLWRMTARIAIR